MPGVFTPGISAVTGKERDTGDTNNEESHSSPDGMLNADRLCYR